MKKYLGLAGAVLDQPLDGVQVPVVHAQLIGNDDAVLDRPLDGVQLPGDDAVLDQGGNDQPLNGVQLPVVDAQQFIANDDDFMDYLDEEVVFDLPVHVLPNRDHGDAEDRVGRENEVFENPLDGENDDPLDGDAVNLIGNVEAPADGENDEDADAPADGENDEDVENNAGKIHVYFETQNKGVCC